MDSDNPWGAPSSSTSPNLTSIDTPPQQDEATPKLSLEVEEDDGDWGTNVEETKEGEEVEVEEERTTKEETNDEKGSRTTDGSEGREAEAKEDKDTTVEAVDPSSPLTSTSNSEQPSLPPPVPLVSAPTTTTTTTEDEGPPMDDFPDDEDDDAFSTNSTPIVPLDSPKPVSLPIATPEPSSEPPMDDFDDFNDDDDDDGFGETQGNGGGDDDEFGDFGDFGDSTPLDESAFDAPPPPSPPPPPSQLPPQFSRTESFASQSLPPLSLTDFSREKKPTRRSVAPQLREFVSNAWENAQDKVSEEPERQVGGVAQVLVTEESRNLLASLSSLPPLRPLDWRRSKIRREHLVSMGIPVNLDDSTESKPLSSLNLSSNSHLSNSIPSRPSSAPPGASPLPFSSSTPRGSITRTSSPFTSTTTTTRTSPPSSTLDVSRAQELVALREEDLTLMTLERLRSLSGELEKISVEASEVLTNALLKREKESQDKETYNGMISDLVSAAAKMKTSSTTTGSNAKGGRGDPKRQGSLRSWGRSGG